MKKQKNNTQLCLINLIALVLVVAVIVSLALYSLGKESTTVFWFVLIVAGVVGYFILPPCRKRCMVN